MDAEKKLERMRFLINRRESALFAVDRAMSQATKRTATITGMPRGGGDGDRMADNVSRIDEAREALKRLDTELKELRRWLGPLIKRIRGRNAGLIRQVMWMRYMQGNKPRKISMETWVSERWVFELLKQGEAEIIKKCAVTSADNVL